MQLREFIRYSSVAAIAIAGILGAAYAQDRGDGDRQSPPPAESPASKMTAQEMAREAGAILEQMEADQKEVDRVLGRAKDDRDVVKVLCLTDKSTQMASAREAAAERAASVRDAAAAQDRELAAHGYTILQVLRERVTQLSAEAGQCIGVEAGFVGDSTVTVDVDPNVPADPSDFLDDPVYTVPPECVSCVL